jgi:hypothetical protein
MTKDDDFEFRYIELLKNIYDEPLLKKPEKGKKPDFDKLEKNLIKSKKVKIENDYDKILNLGITKRQAHKILGEPQSDEGLLETYWIMDYKYIITGIGIKLMEF